MVQNLAFTLFLGLPLIAYGGMLALLLFLSTAAVGLLNYKGIRFIPFKWHPRLAAAAVTVAIIHAFLGLSIFFNF